MFAKIMAGCILTVCPLFWQGVASAQPSSSEVEKGWYDQHEKTLKITINLQCGKIEFIAKDVKDRKLIQPVIMRYDDKQKLESVLWATEAELRHDAKQGALLLDVRKCESRQVSNGSRAQMESRTVSLSLAPTK